jgi:uncharacterized protein YjiS (DUF1127 family)
MSMLNHTSSTSITTGAIYRTVRSSLAWLGHIINSYVAKVIAQREYEANIRLLRSLSDRELMDMGINRTQIGDGLMHAGKDRSTLQEARARLSMIA